MAGPCGPAPFLSHSHWGEEHPPITAYFQQDVAAAPGGGYSGSSMVSPVSSTTSRSALDRVSFFEEMLYSRAFQGP